MSATTSSTPAARFDQLSDDDLRELKRLVREAPLSHPLPASIRCFDFELPPPPHIREIYGAVYRGLSDDYPEAPRHLARLMPREHAKTEAGTVVVPTWAALRDPDIRVLVMSINADKAADKLSEISDYMEDLAPQFGREIVKNNEKQLTLDRQATHEEPTIQAAGFKTGVTGGHYDLLIFDDIVTYETQRTDHRRTKAWQKFQDFLNLDSKQGNPVFLVLGTRKHREDLYSELINSIGWDTRVEKAVSDWSLIENGEYQLKVRHQDTGEERWCSATETGTINPRKETVVAVDVDRPVDVLWPEWAPIEDLIKDMVVGFGADEGTIVWQRENQNDPGAMEGQILSEDMLSWATPGDLPRSGYRLEAGVDLAVEDDPEKAAKNDTDYWAVATVVTEPSKERATVVSLSRKRGMSLKRGLTWIDNQLTTVEDEFGRDVSRVLVESNQAQRWAVQTAEDIGREFKATTSTGNKQDRIIDMSSPFESGRVKLFEPALDDWSSFVQREWCGFPNARHDDRLDAIEIALRSLYVDDGPSGSGTW
mgnify:CR=1 FL=1